MKNLLFSWVYLVLTVLAVVRIDAAAAVEYDPLFTSRELLDITLTGPFEQIDSERDRDKEYPGTLAYRTSSGESVVLDVQFQVRGNYRLRRNVCVYSQLWLNLRTRQAAGTLFENQDRIKLTVQCRSATLYEDALVREQQAYQMFNALSDISFATRLTRVNYQDSDAARRARTELGILVEHPARLAHRLEMTEVELPRISSAELDLQQGALVAMFMYMISNTDYSMVTANEGEECCHNTKLLGTARGTYAPVPYDFDMTGYVNPPYGRPEQGSARVSLRKRVYRGFCAFNQEIAETLKLFNQNRETIAAIVGDAALVSARVARRSADYIDEFYEVINDPEELEEEILSKCR
jgi:hypothetical protein